MNLLFTILTVLFVSASSLVPSLSKSMIDNRRHGLNRIKTSGWATIICYVITISLTYFQFQNNENENKRKEFKADSTQTARDAKQRIDYDSSLSQIKNKFDTSNIKVVKAFGEALGKYGLKLDSANNRLVKIVKDSSKTKIVENQPPALVFYTNSISRAGCTTNFCEYAMDIQSRDAGSTDFHIHYDLIGEDSLRQLTDLGRIQLLNPEATLAKDTKYTANFELPRTTKLSMLYIVIRGTYKDINKIKEYHIGVVNAYNTADKTTRTLNTGKENFYKLIEAIRKPGQ